MLYVRLLWMDHFPFPVLKSAHRGHWSKDKLRWLIAGRKRWHYGHLCVCVCVYRRRQKRVLVWWSHTGNQCRIERRKMLCPGVAAHGPTQKHTYTLNNETNCDALWAKKKDKRLDTGKMSRWYVKLKCNVKERESRVPGLSDTPTQVQFCWF